MKPLLVTYWSYVLARVKQGGSDWVQEDCIDHIADLLAKDFATLSMPCPICGEIATVNADWQYVTCGKHKCALDQLTFKPLTVPAYACELCGRLSC